MSLETNIYFTCSNCKLELNIDKKESGNYGKRCKDCVKKSKNSENKKPREKDIEETDFKNKEWQGGKYSGSVFERLEQNSIICSIGGKQKCFSLNKFENKQQTLEESQKYRKNKSDELGLTTNKYKIIYKDNEPVYLIVQLSKNYVMLCDINDLDKIKKETLCVTKSSYKDSQNYCCIGSNNVERFHKVKTGYEMTDHINGYPLDNRRCNLRETNFKENNKNATKIHKSYIKKLNNQYEVTIIINKNIKDKEIISELFDTKDEAKKFIDSQKKQIDSNLYIDDNYKLKLKKEFEDIMNQYAEGFKWNDKIEDLEENEKINDNNNIQLEKNKSNAQIKKEIYILFKNQIDENWNLNENTILEQRKVEHIIHDNIEYKFCNSCQKWLKLERYTKCSSHKDGLSSQCKDCVKIKKTKS